ncbi:MAG: hypothetical protein ACRDVK_09130 [Acidimicrobiia bacterium]
MSDWWSRIAVGALAVLTLVGGWLLSPPAPNEIPSAPAPATDPYAVCPVAMAGGGFDGRVGIVTDTDLNGQLGGVGLEREPTSFEVGAGQGFTLEVGTLAEVGINPILVETAAGAIGQLAAATYDRAGAVPALAGCTPAASAPVALLGLATNAGEGSSLVISNPFAAEASVTLAGSSEFGPDTPSELEAVRIPAKSTLELVLDQSMAGREQLGFTLQPETGLVIAGMVRSGPDTAISEAIPGARQWHVALPGFGIDGQLIVRSVSAADSVFRIDRIDQSGITDGVESGSLAPGEQLVFSLEEMGGSEGGFVVNSEEDVAVATTYVGEELRTVSAGAPSTAIQWLVPVSATVEEGENALWILNPEETDTTAAIQIFGRSGAPQEIDLPAGSTTGLVVGLDGSGASITAGHPVAVFYGVLNGTRAAMTPAHPLE